MNQQPWRFRYQPTEADLAWARNLIYFLKDGGLWGCSWGVYKINKEERVIELQTVSPDFSPEALSDLLHKTEQMFNALGYKVTRRTANA